jgi:hypothetical protein
MSVRQSKYHRALSVYRDTSRDAWASVLPCLGEVDAAIVRCIAERVYWDAQGMAQLGTGSTCDEVEVVTELKHQTVAAQIRHMVEAGLLEASAERRPTRSGRKAIVWVLADPQTTT